MHVCHQFFFFARKIWKKERAPRLPKNSKSKVQQRKSADYHSIEVKRIPPQTVAIDVEPSDPITSELTRTVYGRSSSGGKTASRAFSARVPVNKKEPLYFQFYLWLSLQFNSFPEGIYWLFRLRTHFEGILVRTTIIMIHPIPVNNQHENVY